MFCFPERGGEGATAVSKLALDPKRVLEMFWELPHSQELPKVISQLGEALPCTPCSSRSPGRAQSSHLALREELLHLELHSLKIPSWRTFQPHWDPALNPARMSSHPYRHRNGIPRHSFAQELHCRHFDSKQLSERVFSTLPELAKPWVSCSL